MSINFKKGNQHPVVLREHYIKQQQKCSLLVDVCSQMSRDWINQGRPHDKNYSVPGSGVITPYKGDFKWDPSNKCLNDELTNNPVKFKDYSFNIKDVIWTAFQFGRLPPFGPLIEPAAFIAYEQGKPNTAYLVFRGSQTGADFGLDAQIAIVANPLGDGEVAEGFAKYFEGCGSNDTPANEEGSRPGQGNVKQHPVPGKTLYESLKNISHNHGGVVKHLIVTGHSLGSTTATFACALACQNGWFTTVVGSVSASPMVGLASFNEWFKTLRADDTTMLNDRFWRLTNLADGVPKLPGGEYVPVGDPNSTQVDFNEKYAGTLLYDSTPVGNVNNVMNNPIIAYPDPGSKFFKREATVNGTRIMAAGLVLGVQYAVPDSWLRKVARMYQLFVNPEGVNINALKQKELIRILRGEIGTYHVGEPTIQRIGYGGGPSYNPHDPLLEVNYEYWNLIPLYDGDPDYEPKPYKGHARNDFIWYQPTGVTPGDGHTDATEVIEHTFHTLHMCGLPAKEMKIYAYLSSDWQTGPTFNAIQQAVDNGVYDPSGYAPQWATNTEQFERAVKEYLYLLNFCMFEYSSLWPGGSLAPEWSDDARTPAGILTNNPLGHALFVEYIQPCIAQPSLAQIEDMFKDGDTGNPKDAGDSNYVPSAGGSEHNPCCTYSYAINHPEQTRNPDIEDCSFPSDA